MRVPILQGVLIFAALASSCQPEAHPFVTVTVSVPPDLEGRVPSLRAAVELLGPDGQSERQELTPMARTFGLRLPVGRQGTLKVRVEGRRGACLTGAGEGSVSVAPEDRAEIPVTLAGPAPVLRGTTVSAPTNQILHAIWGSGAGDLWLVGDFMPLLEDPRRNGATILRGQDREAPGFALIPPANIPNDGNSLWGVWGSGPEDVVAAGVYGNIVRGGSSGATWQRWVSGGLRTGVWGSGAFDIWVVGEPFGGGSNTVHWDEAKVWKDVANPFSGISLTSIWGAAAADVWTVGPKGTIGHWDGTRWQAVPSGVTFDLLSVWGSHARDVWAVGDGGTILRWDGRTWQRVPLPQATSLRAVWGSSAGDVWIARAGGMLLRGGAQGFTAVPSGTSRDLWGLYGACADSVWLVGQGGTVLHFRP